MSPSQVLYTAPAIQQQHQIKLENELFSEALRGLSLAEEQIIKELNIPLELRTAQIEKASFQESLRQVILANQESNYLIAA